MPDRAETLRHNAEILAAGLPQLMIAAERVASTVAPGTHGRRRVGQGETFWQFRRYQPGDSAQDIDWRKSAKSQPLFVRETEWEAAQSAWLWRDTSASMDYASDRSLPTKRERADLLLLALAILLVRGGENIALLESDRLPSHGPGALDRLTLNLARSGNGTPAGAEDALPEFQLLPRYGQLIMIGDFLGPLDEAEARFRRYGARSMTGHIVQVLDPAEETLPFAGRIRFEGFENEGDVLVRRVERARQDYLLRLEAQREGLRQLARRLGWTYTSHRTDKPAQTALLALYTTLSGMIGR
ncbi:MAG: DUF58 domain-containing protein [Alphaproteobacteria bacterium]|nr:DUF58 domain-containing protein [Alphaproteobacteria bacterium]